MLYTWLIQITIITVLKISGKSRRKLASNFSYRGSFCGHPVVSLLELFYLESIFLKSDLGHILLILIK